MRPTTGLTFGGRYELGSRIAIGGMGEVWKATDLVIGRTVAIKILKDEYLGDPGFLERFRAEARHAALVNHEGIANVFDYGEEDGSAFLVMELVPGEALSTVLERERVLPTDKVLDIVAQTASALHAAHAAGLVHRDIKPGNLLITPDGRVKITDFGIARIADQVPLTATGQVMGTVQYLSPEQASGHAASPSTDIYSLGIVAYECLAGRRPFTGESQVAIAMAQINEKAPDLPATVPEPVRNLVYSSIAKNPAERPASAAHMARAATALRRGDVAAAAAAVPAVLGENTDTAATMLMPAAGATTQATTVLPHGLPATAAAPAAVAVDDERKRSPWTWPLIALIVLLVLVLAAILFALFRPDATGTTPATTTTQRSSVPSSSAPVDTPEPTVDTPETVTVLESDLKGRPADEVRAKLEGLQLVANMEEGSAATDPDDVGIVYSVNPTGAVKVGTTITAKYYGDVVKPDAPADPPTIETEGPILPGDEVQVSWPAQTCPSGQELSGYEVFADGNGAEVTSANPTSADTTQATITAGDGDFSVSYRYFCGKVESDKSPSSTVTVTTIPATPPGSPEPTPEG
ncbi:serine/threonine-protein kinase [Cryobacterium tepidiphilum]|uniref:non-specific serine/threonine protein kinase n=1 Tax=Cryobacterium tepidiphilum TaxID=2486026 RepID=A0A3M8LNB4_9MICO|nr:serine/threonine-protein kinase [Cryobacterium tepidiphilum]RNE66970.1 serine/threonine protein kinase [Cryobacterium tepidiphilum]